MSAFVNYWTVTNNLASDMFVFSFIGNGWSIDEYKNKAKELLGEYQCDGILFRIIRENAHGQVVTCYHLYWDGKRFVKDPDFIVHDFSRILNDLSS